MKSVLITGAGGFLGNYLCQSFALEHQVIGVDFSTVPAVAGVDWRSIDTPQELPDVVRKSKPDVVVHAAFVNKPPQSATSLQYLSDMLAANIPLFEALAEINAKLLLVSSSAVYGAGAGYEVIDECCPLQPVSLYGAAKLIQEQTARFYAANGLQLSIARLFNLCGPGQRPGMLLPDWVTKALAIVNGESTEFRVRHRRSSRDFVDARDASTAIMLLAERFKNNEVANVANCKAVSLMEISEELAAISPVPINFVEEDAVADQSDVDAQCGSNELIRNQYGWAPSFDWRTSLRDLWESLEK